MSPRSHEDLLESARRRVAPVSLDDLHARRRAGAALLLLDVREEHEFRDGHIEGAVNAPRSSLESAMESIAPQRDTPLVLYCQRNTRSALAAATLVDMGYTRVERAEEGYASWLARGFPVTLPGGDAGLTDAQRQRYARHLLLPEVGAAGQRALLRARVLLLGAGGLGSPVALYLAAAGVGTLGIVDDDVVDVSNLQRQVLHTTARVGQRKVDSAERALAALNPEVRVVKHAERLVASNVDALFAGYDLVVDGCDNFATRYLANDAALRAGIPVAHGSVHRFEGQVTTFVPGEGACYRCLYPAPPPPELAPSCQAVGVLGVLPGVIGLIQATEALKRLLGRGEGLVDRLLTYDALEMRFRELRYRRDPRCAACGDGVRASCESTGG